MRGGIFLCVVLFIFLSFIFIFYVYEDEVRGKYLNFF